jgi:hypothetical protein
MSTRLLRCGLHSIKSIGFPTRHSDLSAKRRRVGMRNQSSQTTMDFPFRSDRYYYSGFSGRAGGDVSSLGFFILFFVIPDTHCGGMMG